jgi:serine/threonine protein kinase
VKVKNSFFDCINFKVIILTAAVFLFLTAAPAEALEIISLPVEKTEKDLYQIEAEIPILMDLNHKNIAEEYNDLFRDNIMTFIEYTIEMARQSQRDFAEAEFPRREFVGRVDFDLKNSSQILSIKFNYYQYTGGAHGNPYSLSYNIDLATGEDLNLVDFLEREKMILSEVEEVIKSEIKKEQDLYFQDDYGFQSLAEDQCYYLENGELVVYFQPYAIAPYSTGMPEFRIEY